MVDHMTLVAIPRPEMAGEIDVDRAQIELTPTGPIELRTIDAEVVTAACVEKGIPTV